MTDNYYQNSGNKVVFVGGGWYHGNYCGLWFFDCRDTSSLTHAAVGARLLLKAN